MNRPLIVLVAGTSFYIGIVSLSFAQGVQRSEAIASSDILSQISMFNYREGPKSDLVFRPTPIAANAEGKAEVEYQNGNAAISAKVDNLPEPSSLGPYTTYVLWALTPDGRAINQGVLGSHEGGKGEIKTSYGASQFALIVTAEPHFAVSAPSSMVALYNVADKVEGDQTRVSTLVERAEYANLTKIPIDEEANTVEVVQARYAVAIAKAAGAETYSPEAYRTATTQLAAAETALAGGRKTRDAAPGAAREAVVAGEDARRAAMAGAAEAAAEAERVAAEADRVAAVEAANRQAAAKAREDLINRLNMALPTRETDRGLVSEIGGVQFATGTAQLSSPAQLGLSRFAGAVSSYPDLRFKIEGHTDSTGDPAKNNALSLQRATAVRDFLVGQGIVVSRIEVAGLGPSMPVADNGTAEGRARNRRVEIVISGPPLTQATTATASR